jgi:hypothetical protein
MEIGDFRKEGRMAIPDFQTIMLPLSKLFEDDNEHSRAYFAR